MVALVVVVGFVVALAGGHSGSDADTPDHGPVLSEGPSLPERGGGGDDPAAGEAAPLVEGTDPDGAAVTIGGPSSGDGQPTLIAFLAHWCPHCQAEVPVLVDLMEDGSLDGVRTVAVLTASDERRPNHPPVAWLEREGWTGEVLLDDERGSAADAYGLDGFPFLVFVNSDGTVAARTSGEIGADALRGLVGQLD